jgi:hypothetical protein
MALKQTSCLGTTLGMKKFPLLKEVTFSLRWYALVAFLCLPISFQVSRKCELEENRLVKVNAEVMSSVRGQGYSRSTPEKYRTKVTFMVPGFAGSWGQVFTMTEMKKGDLLTIWPDPTEHNRVYQYRVVPC